MIKARMSDKSADLETRLVALAGRLALAELAKLQMKRTGDGRHWRDARLLWPLFNKDQ